MKKIALSIIFCTIMLLSYMFLQPFYWLILTSVVILIVFGFILLAYQKNRTDNMILPSIIATFDTEGNYIEWVGNFADENDQFFYFYTLPIFQKLWKQGADDTNDYDFSFLAKNEQEILLSEFLLLLQTLQDNTMIHSVDSQWNILQKNSNEIRAWLMKFTLILEASLKKNLVVWLQIS